MKKMGKTIYLVLSIILGVSTVAPVKAAEYTPDAANTASVSGNDIEIISQEVELEKYLESQGIVNGTLPADWYAEFPERYNEAQAVAETSLSSLGIDESASSYDPRTLNKVSEVRLQTGGTCWLYAAVAACESNLIHKGYEDNSVDLSELQLLYFAKNGFTDKLGNYTRSTSGDGLTMKEFMSEGGNPVTVAHQLAQWCGPISEERASIPPFPTLSSNERIEYVAAATLDSSMAQEAEYHLCGTRKLSGNTRNPTSVIPYVKELIAGYGGVTAGYYASASHDNILESGDNAHYCAYDKGTNHAIDVIGWDDAFSASNFKTQPSGNGAWLCKNSNGVTSTTNGFVWISYYDRTLCDFLAFDLEEADKYENVYGYRSGDVAMDINYTEESDETTVNHTMSVFEASAYGKGMAEKVEAVLVDALYADKEYNITLYANPVVEDGKLVGYTGKTDTKTIKTDYAGMYKVDFSDSPLYVLDGCTFGIYVEDNGYSHGETSQFCKAYTNRADGFVKVNRVSFSCQELIMAENVARQILPTVLPENATKKNCSFSSSDESVAVVDEYGTVRPVGFGECDITAVSYDGAASGSYHVIVKCTELSLADNRVYAGETLQMNPGTLNNVQGITADKVTWAVSDTAVAEIDSNGVLTGKKAGEVTVTATLKENEAVSASCTVTVLQKATSFIIDNVDESNRLCLFVEDTEQLSATFLPEGTTEQPLGYTVVSGKDKISVDENGVITALKSGIASVEAKTLDGSKLSRTFDVRVFPKITDISATVNNGADFNQNQSVPVSIGLGQDASLIKDKINVSFSNPAAVQVEGITCYNTYDFRITVKEAGTYTMTVTVDDKNQTSKTVTFKVLSVGSEDTTGGNSDNKDEDKTDDKTKNPKSFTVSKMNYKVIGDTVTLTGTSAMGATITVPSKVKYQGKSYKVTKIATKAFKGNSKAKSVVIPGSVTEIGTSAFEGCSKLKTVTLNNGITNIGNNAFKGCKELTKVTIPASVTKIGTDAFKDCVKLQTVSFKSGSKLESMGNNVFSGCKALTKITLPDKLKAVPQKAFYNCSKLKTVTLGKNITSIGASAFSGTAITKITIPAKVKTIGKNAFYNCTKLKNVTFSGTKVTSVGTKAFSKMNKEGSIKVPGSKLKAYTKLLKGKYTKGVKIK